MASDEPGNPLPPRRCEFCHKLDGSLSLCSACRVVHYCNRDHQAKHRQLHKQVCNVIKGNRKDVVENEQKLRAHRDGDFFQFAAGKFWGFHETRPYMIARQGLIDSIINLTTRDAVSEALDHMMDMLRLSSQDNMDIRSQVPAHLVRLGRDQEAYDFIKGWTLSVDDKYDNVEDHNGEPVREAKDSDLFESVDMFKDYGAGGDLSFSVCLTLLKIRLLNDLKMLQATALTDRDELRSKLDSVVLKQNDIISGGDHQDRINELEKQIETLYEWVDKTNKHMWKSLCAPQIIMKKPFPHLMSQGSPEEVRITMHYVVHSWYETKGATEKIAQMYLARRG